MDITGKTLIDHGGCSGGRTRKHSASSASSGQGIGSGSDTRTWQSILDALTIKGRKDGLLRAVQNERGFEARLRKVMDSIAVRYGQLLNHTYICRTKYKGTLFETH